MVVAVVHTHWSPHFILVLRTFLLFVQLASPFPGLPYLLPPSYQISKDLLILITYIVFERLEL